MAPQLTPVDDHRRTQPTRRRARWAVLALGAVLFAGCSRVPSNTPTEYGQVTEDNFASACAESGEKESDCRCFYDAIVRDVPFDEFKDLETRVKDDPTDVPATYEDIVTACQAGETVGPTADPDTTTSTVSPS